MSDDSYAVQSSSWRYRAAFGLLVVVVLLAVAAWKGGGGPNGAALEESNGQPEKSEADELERQLSAGLDGLRPERLGVSVDAGGVVDSMNLWWADYTQADGVEIPELGTDAVREIYGEAAAEYAAARRFNTRDMAYVRNCQMYRAVVERIAELADTEVERAMAAFQFVVENVELSPGTSAGNPVTPFEVLLLGRGRPADRAWLFCEILRQFGTDCVLIAPADEDSTEPATARLVGVIGSSGDIYLFDVQMGLPIPTVNADSDSWQVDRPATLEEVRANDSLFRQFDVDGGQTYPFTAERLAEIQVKFVSQSEHSASRLAGLQQALSAEYATFLIDPLTATSDGSPGLLDRIRDAGSNGRWSEDQIVAWEYPEDRTTAFEAAGAEDAEELSQAMRRMAGPRVQRTEIVDDTTQSVNIIGNSDRPLRYVRVQQLRGDLTDALVGYGSIRSDAVFVQDAVNDEAREYSIYWIAVCQFGLGRYESCLGTLAIYEKDYQNGVWGKAASRLQAFCNAKLGRFDVAIEVLETAAQNGTASLSDAFYLHRWRAVSDKESETGA